MFAAHIAAVGEYQEGGWRWLLATHGRASAIFTVLAGVSIALMLSRSRGLNPVRHTRIRVAVRGVILIALGWILGDLGTPVDVILDNLGVMFFLALIALRWKPVVLIGVGAGVLLLGRELLAPVVAAMPQWLYDAPLLHELWGIHYPALIWIGYVLIGMGIGKLAPWRGAALGWLAASGIALAAVAYGIGALLLTNAGEPVIWASIWPPPDQWFVVAAHSYSAPEMLGNVGVAMFTIAACCLLANWLPRVVWPFAAAGSMTLTLYSAHIVLIAIVGREIVYEPSNLAWIVLCVSCLVFASLWRWRLGQGPLERVVTSASNGVAAFDELRVTPRA